MTGAHPEHILVQIVNISTAQLATTTVPSYKLWSGLHKKPILHIILVLTGAHIFRLQEVGLPSPMLMSCWVNIFLSIYRINLCIIDVLHFVIDN